MNNWVKTSLVAFVASFVLVSCSKDENNISPSVSEEVAVVSDESYASLQLDMSEEEMDEVNTPANGRETGRKPFEASCATVTLDTTNRMLTVDFGTTGCVCKDGKTRKGKIIRTWSADKKSETITYDNYFVDGNKIEGTRTRTLLSGSLETGRKFEVTLVGGKVTFTDGTFTTLDGNWVRQYDKLAEAKSTETGTCNGIGKNGVKFTSTVEKPLVRKMSCFETKIPFIVEGIRKVTLEKEGVTKNASIDYGNGSCDNKATVTVDGVTKEIELGKRNNG
ncbi:MAG: hypothetical protein OHK0038_27090 [Flammeovirgaceae bacterium]